jgi:hypothetical protein
MTDPNWTVPERTSDGDRATAVPPAAPEPLYVAGQPFPFPPPHFDPAAPSWGLAVPGVNYALLVPRPPRPAVVSTALMLAYIGVGLSALIEVATAIYQWNNREKIFDSVSSSEPTALEAKRLMDASATLGLVIGGLLWLIVAAGVVICAVLAHRKKNPARIVLAAAMGVVGLYNLCGVGSAALVGSIGNALERGSADSGFTFSATSAQITWWSVTGEAVLGGLALTVLVLLVVPPANRYFVAGAGRRFVSEV